MQIILHPGPYKTGTTSIQDHLLNVIGSEKPVGPNWYPTPLTGGRGHAALARAALEGRPEDLRGVIAVARAAGIEKLVLSSEVFTDAYPNRFSDLASVLGQNVHLIMTLRSPVVRFGSIWQTMVRHGHSLSVESSPNLFKRPAYQPDFVSKFVAGLSPERTSLICTGAADPAVLLIQNTCRAIGLEPPVGEPNRMNTSVGYIEAELLRALNILLDLHAPDISKMDRIVLLRILETPLKGKHWRSHCPAVPIPVPKNLLPRLQALAEASFADVLKVAGNPSVHIMGNPECLLERDVKIQETTPEIIERNAAKMQVAKPEIASQISRPANRSVTYRLWRKLRRKIVLAAGG